MPDAALLDAIRAILAGRPFYGEGHRKVWVRLRMAGACTCKRRMLRLAGEHGLLAPSRVGTPQDLRNHGENAISRRDGTIIPDRVDAM